MPLGAGFENLTIWVIRVRFLFSFGGLKCELSDPAPEPRLSPAAMLYPSLWVGTFWNCKLSLPMLGRYLKSHVLENRKLEDS